MASARRSGPELYSDVAGIDGHRLRLCLAEKGVAVRVRWVEAGDGEALAALGPRAGVPTLVDRDLVLGGTRAALEYVDERYPHPPFMPAEPAARAAVRLALERIEVDWYSLVPEPTELARRDAPHVGLAPKARAKRLAASLVEASEAFDAMPFLLSDSYSILDATVVPLLWRLPRYGIVPKEVGPSVAAYAKRMFARPGFDASLSADEREMGGWS